MLRPSPNHGTQRLPNDDDDFYMQIPMIYTPCMCVCVFIKATIRRICVDGVAAYYIYIYIHTVGDGSRDNNRASDKTRGEYYIRMFKTINNEI